jgi:dynein heavy chain 2
MRHHFPFSEAKFDCIRVSTAPVKTAIDDLLQRLFDTLLFTLRYSIQSDLQSTGQFVTDAITMLSTRPQSIDEIAEANSKHQEFGKRKPEVWL